MHRPPDRRAAHIDGHPLAARPRLVTVRALIITVAFFLLYIRSTDPTVSVDEIEISAAEVKTWALKFGISVFHSCQQATCVRKITDNFNRFEARAEYVDANKMAKEMRTDVSNMMSWKTRSVKNIRDVAEHAVTKHTYDPEIKLEYLNAKKLYDPKEGKSPGPEYKPLEFLPHKNFDGTPVNTNHSIVHVPTNVYDKSAEVLNAIKWSEELNPTFKNNINFDPFLIWQFFGSSSGFLRLYPAVKWRVPEDPDMYDCRMRPWYIQGASSSKDVVILLDGSGSMTGLRKEIARNVVLNILETLSDNDFVTILRFSESVKAVVPCFENTLVQANEGNLREFRELLKDLDTVNIANFTLGLITAFELLQKVAKNDEGSQCNQAIMLITDGAPYTYENIFSQYNWPNIPIRVFTYLIGREVTDMDEVQWMACNNRGYYTHVTTLAEVREQVQKYIPVMSRPVVLAGQHPIVWSSVYADVSDVKLTDWLWQDLERAKIRKRIFSDREKRQKVEENFMQAFPESNNLSKMDHYVRDSPSLEYVAESENNRKPPKEKSRPYLMITVSTPVFDKRNCSNVTERIRSSKNIWIERTREMRVANILGVAGIDVPIDEIIKLTPPYKLGVNGYSFVVTNNGYVLYHPDFRPLHQKMLKPGYSSVDMTEVELVDDDRRPRDLNETLLLIKNTTINRQVGWKSLSVKAHLDSKKRVVTRNNTYYYGPIDDTPFSLVIVLPDNYGHYRVEGRIEVKRKNMDWNQHFRGNNWRVHPNWVYCETPINEGDPYTSPEDMIRNFIKEAQTTQKFRWRSESVSPPLRDQPICDKILVQSLVFDAKATDIGAEKCPPPSSTQNEDQVIKIHGIVTTFVATRSGLLRFEDHRTEEEKNNSTERPFYEIHTRATDELFYQRAVDFYHINNTAFVFSVPFDAGLRNSSLVTASQAIFLGKGKQMAPAAVVGVQFKHAVFVERFFNITGMCMQECKYKCTDQALDCYLLDSNGFIIVSETHEHTGKFFGEIDYNLFDSMVEESIYRKVHMYDYQAICVDTIYPSGPANYMRTPFMYVVNILYWIWSKLFMLLLQSQIVPWWSENWVAASDDYYDTFAYEDERVIYNKTRPRPCDTEFDLFEMQPTNSWEPVRGVLQKCHSSGCDKNYIVQRVPHTNLVMLVIYNECPCDTRSMSLEPKEIHYDEEERCQRMRNGTLRKLPEPCINHHPEEAGIRQQCGNGSFICASIYTIVGALMLCWSKILV